MLKRTILLCLLPFATSLPGRESSWKSIVIEDLELELIHVKAGIFTMGSLPGEPQHDKAEGPRMEVTFTHPFWLGKTEVTQAQYEAIAGINPSRLQEVGPTAPVEEVSWDDAMKFCKILTIREKEAKRLPKGYEYTLPTEAQWEYACRAGTTSDYAGNPASMGWSNGNSKGTTHPVAQLRPNQWGIYDMSGNVLEWCLDWYDNYPSGKVKNPKGPAHGYFRIARGGSWRMDAHIGRSAARAGGSQGRRDYTIGFRLALSRVEK